MKATYSFLILFALTFLLRGCCDEIPHAYEHYESVKIGSQTWMLKNLNVNHYRNGDLITEARDFDQLYNMRTGAWCYIMFDEDFEPIFGKLYNWYAVTDPRGLAPEGWHIPTDDEWKELEMYLGLTQELSDKPGCRGVNEGGKLKATGIREKRNGWWKRPNVGATNETGFSALPGGSMTDGGSGHEITGYWWSTTELNKDAAWYRVLLYDSPAICRGFYYKASCFSVRCIKD